MALPMSDEEYVQGKDVGWRSGVGYNGCCCVRPCASEQLRPVFLRIGPYVMPTVFTNHSTG